MKTDRCILLLLPLLTGCAHIRTTQELARQYEVAHARKDIPAILALYDTREAPAIEITHAMIDEKEDVDLQITKTDIQRLSGSRHFFPKSREMVVHFNTENQTNRSSIAVSQSRIIKRVGLSWFFPVPASDQGNRDSDWECFRARFSDADLLYYRMRAKEVLNDTQVWQKLNREFHGPFEAGSDDFTYEFDSSSRDAPKVVVSIPLKQRNGFHLSLVEVTFQRHLKGDLENEIVRIELVHTL
jgi:hypothetical protein